MKTIISVVIVVVIVAGGYFLLDKEPETPEEQPLKIGIAASLTGYAANWGEGEVKAMEIALEDYKDKLGVLVELIIEDTKTTDVGTVSAVKKLIEIDHVVAIIGPTWGDSFQGGTPISEQAKVVLLSPSSAMETIKDKELHPYLLSTWWPQEAEINTLIDHVEKSGITRFSTVNDQDPFNVQISDSLVAGFEARGKKDLIGLRVTVPVATKDFRTNITKIKADKAKGVFVQLQDTSLMGPFMKQLKEQNVDVLVYATPDAENIDNINKFPGYFDGLLYAFPSYSDDSSYEVLINKLKSKYGADVSQGPSFVNAYNAGTMLFEAIASGARTGEEIKDALNKVHVPGVGSKDLYFNEKGQIGDVKFIMKTIVDNKFVELK